MKIPSSLITTLIFLFLFSQNSWGWGGRGHTSICAVDTNLVSEPGLKDFLQMRPHVMGHLCNIPDIYWKGINAEITQMGHPPHFFQSEILEADINNIPTDFKKLVEKYTGMPNKFNPDLKIISVAREVGSLWWRADQFYRLALGLKEDFKKAVPPTQRSEEQNEELLYNKTIFSLMTNLGLMGHFTGDASQPVHNSADYDGYKAGHGGIHAYYEETVITYFDADMQARIAAEARKLKKSTPAFLKAGSVVEKMQALSALSYSDLKKIYKLDPVLKPSIIKKENGIEIKTPAVRKPAQEGYKVFNELIVKEMARSALLTAQLWDEAYVALGKPNLSAYRSFKFPFNPEFVPPDYLETVNSQIEKTK